MATLSLNDDYDECLNSIGDLLNKLAAGNATMLVMQYMNTVHAIGLIQVAL